MFLLARVLGKRGNIENFGVLESAEFLLEMDKVCVVNYNIYLLGAETFCQTEQKENGKIKEEV